MPLELVGLITSMPAETTYVPLAGPSSPDGDVDVVVPGHGSVGGADQVQERIDQDRAYVLALRNGQDPADPRVGPSAKPGWEWVSDVHEGQLQRVTQRDERDGESIATENYYPSAGASAPSPG